MIMTYMLLSNDLEYEIEAVGDGDEVRRLAKEEGEHWFAADDDKEEDYRGPKITDEYVESCERVLIKGASFLDGRWYAAPLNGYRLSKGWVAVSWQEYEDKLL